jgi:hypothetical protein
MAGSEPYRDEVATAHPFAHIKISARCACKDQCKIIMSAFPAGEKEKPPVAVVEFELKW